MTLRLALPALDVFVRPFRPTILYQLRLEALLDTRLRLNLATGHQDTETTYAARPPRFHESDYCYCVFCRHCFLLDKRGPSLSGGASAEQHHCRTDAARHGWQQDQCITDAG